MIYRGFDIDFNGCIWLIKECGKIIDDAATDEMAMTKIDKLLEQRRKEDVLELKSSYRR